jgi:hypothetical protein
MEKHNFNYRRINHFTEVLNKLQAKQTTDIPEEVMAGVRLELRKQRVTDFHTVTKQQIRVLLRKTGHDKYYDYDQFILSLLTGTPSDQLHPDTVEYLNQLFNEASSMWFIHRPEKRSSLISYPYICYKLFELLNLDEWMARCELVKTRERLVEYDKVWKNICTDLRWEYIPTV